MKDDKVEGMIVAIVLVMILLIAWLFPIAYLSHKIDKLREDKQEVVVIVEHIYPQEPPEDALEIEVNKEYRGE